MSNAAHLFVIIQEGLFTHYADWNTGLMVPDKTHESLCQNVVLELGRLVDELAGEMKRRRKAMEDSARFGCGWIRCFPDFDFMRGIMPPSFQDVCGAGSDIVRICRFTDHTLSERAENAGIVLPRLSAGLRISGAQTGGETRPAGNTGPAE